MELPADATGAASCPNLIVQVIFAQRLTDISQLKEAQAKIHSLAFFDPLTQLPNRRLLLDRLRRAVASSARRKGYGAVLLIDLDNFKLLNDTQGHEVGDQLLVEVAHRLKSCVRDQDSLAHQGLSLIHI